MTDVELLRLRLGAPDPSVRLSAALAAGSEPGAVPLEVLIERCAVEPDFFVRDMLTWALVRQPADAVVPLLLAEIGSPNPQARSQALHTLSKIGSRRTFPAAAGSVHDVDDEVARSAWRAAVTLVPPGEEQALAGLLAEELGRGDRELRLSLSRALIALGEDVRPLLDHAAGSDAAKRRTHAIATLRMLDDPGSDPGSALLD